LNKQLDKGPVPLLREEVLKMLELAWGELIEEALQKLRIVPEGLSERVERL